MTGVDRVALRALADEEKLTSGPWTVSPNATMVFRQFEFFGPQVEVVADILPNPDDARFIAAARSAVPALLDAIEAAEALADKLAASDMPFSGSQWVADEIRRALGGAE